MKEEIVKEVLLKYFERQGKNPRKRPKQASGPDILIEGTAIEVKGDQIDRLSVIKQLAIYLHDYNYVEVAFPCEALSISFLYKLRALEEFNRRGGLERSVTVYLIAAMDSQQFAVLPFSSVSLLLIKVSQILYEMSGQVSGDAPLKKAQLAFCVDQEIRRELEDVVKREGQKIVT